MSDRTIFRHRLFKADLAEHYHYIAMERPTAANRFVYEVRKACELVVAFPSAGKLIELLPTLPFELRQIIVSKRFRNWLILYRIDANAIRFLRLVHGARDLRAEIRSLIPGDDE
jgi:plasmid stabilization system protein ParE